MKARFAQRASPVPAVFSWRDEIITAFRSLFLTLYQIRKKCQDFLVFFRAWIFLLSDCYQANFAKDVFCDAWCLARDRPSRYGEERRHRADANCRN